MSTMASKLLIIRPFGMYFIQTNSKINTNSKKSNLCTHFWPCSIYPCRFICTYHWICTSILKLAHDISRTVKVRAGIVFVERKTTFIFISRYTLYEAFLIQFCTSNMQIYPYHKAVLTPNPITSHNVSKPGSNWQINNSMGHIPAQFIDIMVCLYGWYDYGPIYAIYSPRRQHRKKCYTGTLRWCGVAL